MKYYLFAGEDEDYLAEREQYVSVFITSYFESARLFRNKEDAQHWIDDNYEYKPRSKMYSVELVNFICVD